MRLVSMEQKMVLGFLQKRIISAQSVGRNLKEKHRSKLTCYESTQTPAPGYANSAERDLKLRRKLKPTRRLMEKRLCSVICAS